MNPAIIFLPCALLAPSLLSGGELAGSLAAQQSQAPDKTASSKSEKTKPATPAMTSLLPPPEPPFPVEKLGAHAAVVREVQKLLKDGALEEFYTTTRKRLQERSAKDTDTWGGIIKKSFNSREEAYAYDWLYFHYITAPLLPNEDERTLEKQPWPDLWARERSTLNDDNHDYWHPSDPPQFTKEETMEHSLLHLEYRAYVERWKRFTSKRLQEEIKGKVKSGTGKYPFRYAIYAMRGGFRYKNYEQRLETILALDDKDRRDEFVKQLIHRYPNDVGMIHKYLRKAGLETNDELWEAISRIFLYTSESAYFYTGLSMPDGGPEISIPEPMY